MENDSLKISAEVLLNEYNCLVCFLQVEDCYITKCGHLFCKKCIDESVNRFHKCPYCQTELQDIDIFRDYALTNLKKIITDEKEKAETTYLNKVYNALQQENDELEKVFLTGLKDMIVAYRACINESRDQFAIMKEKVAKEYKQRSEDAPAAKGMLDEALNHEFKRLEEDFRLVKDYTIESLQSSLKTAVPEPKMLEVRSSLALPQKNVVISNIRLHPSSSIKSIMTELEEYFIKQNDPIQDIDPQKIHLVFVPPERKLQSHKLLAEGGQIKTEADLNTYIAMLNAQGFASKPLASDELFLKQNIKQNGVIYIYGVFTLKNEAPVECMTHNYQPGTVMNYFACSQCGINWICTSCAEHCHKGHSLVPFLQNQTTSWACCYCTTKGFCKYKECQLVNLTSSLH